MIGKILPHVYEHVSVVLKSIITVHFLHICFVMFSGQLFLLYQYWVYKTKGWRKMKRKKPILIRNHWCSYVCLGWYLSSWIYSFLSKIKKIEQKNLWKDLELRVVHDIATETISEFFSKNISSWMHLIEALIF